MLSVKEIRALTGLSQIKFCAKYHIPRRTLECWESPAGNPPEYIVELLEFRVKSDIKEANVMMKKNLEAVELYEMDCTVRFDPEKIRPVIIDGTDVYDKAVITEGPEPLLIGFNDGLNEWVCLGSPDQLGWEWVAPDPDDAESIAQAIRASDTWQLDLDDRSPERMLCKLAGMEQELEDADDEEFESVIEAAADKLGVEIY